jgi:hypothetical protein
LTGDFSPAVSSPTKRLAPRLHLDLAHRLLVLVRALADSGELVVGHGDTAARQSGRRNERRG